MDVLPTNFVIYKWFGMWPEDNKEYKYLKKFNKYLAIFALMYYVSTQIGLILSLTTDIDQITEFLYMLVSIVAVVFKLFHVNYHQDSIMTIIQEFLLAICQRNTKQEINIYAKYQKTAHFMLMFLMIFTEFVGTSIMLAPLFIKVDGKMPLPLPTYNILGLPDDVFFYSSYVLQVLSTLQGVCMGVSFDALLIGLMVLVTGQLDILRHRLQNLSLEEDFVIDYSIKHHLVIHRIIQKIQKTFMSFVALLFAMSLESYCTSIFQISEKNPLNYEFWTVAIYLLAILSQTFLYCWFGNEVREKSQSLANEIYRSQWLSMNPGQRKKLCLMMMRAQKGSQISFHNQVNLSNNTFFYIVKTAYGVFNLLRRRAQF